MYWRLSLTFSSRNFTVYRSVTLKYTLRESSLLLLLMMTSAHQLEIGLSASKNSFNVCVCICVYECAWLFVFAISNLTTSNSGLVKCTGARIESALVQGKGLCFHNHNHVNILKRTASGARSSFNWFCYLPAKWPCGSASGTSSYCVKLSASVHPLLSIWSINVINTKKVEGAFRT